MNPLMFYQWLRLHFINVDINTKGIAPLNRDAIITLDIAATLICDIDILFFAVIDLL